MWLRKHSEQTNFHMLAKSGIVCQ